MRDSLKDKTLNLTLDGVTKSINLKDLAGARDDETFQTLLKDEVKKAFGEKVSVNFTDADSDGFKISFEAVQDGSTLSVSGTAASSLGFSSGDGNFINTGKKISELLENKLGDAFKPTNRMRASLPMRSPPPSRRPDPTAVYTMWMPRVTMWTKTAIGWTRTATLSMSLRSTTPPLKSRRKRPWRA